ncbi:hypothetical protein OF377_02955 [Ureaplasma sp. ES3154-GEN]|uniref:hypothetical protein n=1 Tax=Ureaplasma sp. ES3154-GEN TaxID=2984844 RepID=UPI0021E79F8D|nr:hypothetical protein [Ureaplasma sp. ES3154-GEN]MCV3743819.1 hypothetical protein [Ureaplasma sp. ES3154-GEN]
MGKKFNKIKLYHAGLGIFGACLLCTTTACSLVIPDNLSFKTYVGLANDILAGLDNKIINNKAAILQLKEVSSHFTFVDEIQTKLSTNARFLARQQVNRKLLTDIKIYQDKQAQVLKTVDNDGLTDFQSYLTYDYKRIKIVSLAFFKEFMTTQRISQFDSFKALNSEQITSVTFNKNPDDLNVSFFVYFQDPSVPPIKIILDQHLGIKLFKYQMYSLMINTTNAYIKKHSANDFVGIFNYQDLERYLTNAAYKKFFDNQLKINMYLQFNNLYTQQKDIVYAYQKEKILKQ